MSAWGQPIAALLGLALAMSPAGVASAQPAGVEPKEVGGARTGVLEFARDRIRPCELTVADAPGRRCELAPDPIARFENPVSRNQDGFLFLWTHRGRPAAVVKAFYNANTERWGRSFVSLSPGPLELRDGDRILWSPRDPGVAFAPLPGASPPASQPRQRLAQLREIARRFQGVDRRGPETPTDWQLRLLMTPLHRYEAPDEGVVDGALFGYVVWTSPEALVLVEARRSDAGLSWHYAVARCTGFEVRMTLDGREVASLPRLDRWAARDTYFHVAVPMPDYPFKRGRDAAEPAR